MSESSNDTEKEVEVAPKARSPIPPDTILIGSKPVMAYVTAVMMHFQVGGKNVLTIKARGRAISRAVDVVEVVRRRFFGGKLTVKDVQIGTQALGEGGDVRNVSTIEIKVEKTD
jgi:DNA-binding protein